MTHDAAKPAGPRPQAGAQSEPRPDAAAPGHARPEAAAQSQPRPQAERFIMATFNRHKAAELHALLALPGVTLVPLADWPAAESPDETGTTLLANALIKARYAAALTGLPAIADDTGLEVDALGGEPGVFAARYAGANASYADNVAKLLRELAGVPIAQRTARFRTACVAVWPDGRELHADGVLEGVIIESQRGTNGFGYDPVFMPVGDVRSVSELTDAEKNANSHRARAVKALAAKLTAAGGE